MDTYEFRAFDVDLDAIARRLDAAALGSELTRTHETYLVTRLNVDVGIKLREGRLEVKELQSREGLLERWERTITLELPVSGPVIRDRIAPLLGVELEASAADLDETALRTLVASVPALAWVPIKKERRVYRFERGHAETAEIEMNGLRLQSAAVETPEAEWALEAIALAGIETKDNESYPARLQRLAFT